MTRGALVRNTRSIEALGRVDVLGLDKTGTLTEGRLEFVGLTQGARFVGRDELLDDERLTLASALRATPDIRYSTVQTDPTDAALFRAADALRLSATLGRADWERGAELPFEPGRSYHAVEGRSLERFYLDVKGAPFVTAPRARRSRSMPSRERRLSNSSSNWGDAAIGCSP
jgi:magnesium-transporting ATPase (P-type)